MNSPLGRSAGILLPAFSPRRPGDLGIGDTRSFRDWIDWAADHQVGFLQLLPIQETGDDNSPYNAISSIALEPLVVGGNHCTSTWPEAGVPLTERGAPGVPSS